MLEALIAMIPMIAAGITPPLIMIVRDQITKVVAPKWFPVMLPILGGVVAGIANLLGVDATILQTTSQDINAWETVVQGILAGSASVGLHQVGKQAKKVE